MFHKFKEFSEEMNRTYQFRDDCMCGPAKTSHSYKLVNRFSFFTGSYRKTTGIRLKICHYPEFIAASLNNL